MKATFNLSHLPRKNKGFTLIEVLVSAFILFLVLAAISMVYRGALLSSHKAERTLQFSALVVPISEQIRFQIQSSTNNAQQGQGSMGAVTYKWVAQQEFASQAPPLLDAESGGVSQSNNIFTLWHVSLTLQLKTTTREYYFYEVSW
jgi:Tfp pilus assembly protein PilV